MADSYLPTSVDPYGQYPEQEHKKGMNPMVAGLGGAALGAAGGAWVSGLADRMPMIADPDL
jgi:hypothetical protein